MDPGDVVIGDIDGVAVVPNSLAESVLHDAEELANTENSVRDAVRDGVDPVTAYEEFGVF